MKNRFSSIRYILIRSHLYNMFLTSILLLTILLSVYVLVEPEWLSVQGIFLFTILYALIAFIISLYTGFKDIGNILKTKLDSISLLITQFSNGNYDSSIQFPKSMDQEDEITRIAKDLNELGNKLQNQVKSLQRMADEKADFAKSAHKAAVIEERQRIARDLHDAVSQQLFALTMISEASIKQFEKNPVLAKKQMKEVATAALQAQTEMRALLLHLRPVHLSGDTLEKGIHKLIEELKQKSSIDFKVSIKEELKLSEAIEEHVFRIVQESLSNILRHANANKVHVDIFKKSKELFVHIQDDGKGFDVVNDAEKKTSYGLKTMRERSEELGGTFVIRSIPDEGTYIDIRIPC
ncbi:sensor histidine kinase [Oceanobacillus polygoni]|uniref:Sensor histidine kinase n=1 Tax=Oceanobacillus polygoni TaxID=1235259 RepID=A0A9X1CDX3_9BACI|nr:sensor histidine kinase [Oceanobacillus polygoni]MBP2076645.1 NarL family two-component system sensor histidine kinase LiaS [Oceanobacillus polygoni]